MGEEILEIVIQFLKFGTGKSGSGIFRFAGQGFRSIRLTIDYHLRQS